MIKLIFICSIFLSSCMTNHQDALEGITDEVIKKNTGVNIEITPEKAKR